MSRPFQWIVALLLAPLAGAGTGWLTVAVLCLGDPKFGDGCGEAWLPALSFAIVSTITCAFGFVWALRPPTAAARARAALAVIGSVQVGLLIVAALHLPNLWFWAVAGLAAAVGVVLTRDEPALDT